MRDALALLLLASATTIFAAPVVYVDREIEREGLRMRLRVEATGEGAAAHPSAGQFVKLTLTGKRLSDRQPLKNWQLGAWLDREMDPLSGTLPSCQNRIARYLSGNLMTRPLLDLTGYYVISLDAEPSISILDPSVNFSGRSSLYKSIKLAGPGFDWIKTEDDTRLFVALRTANKVAAIDLQSLTAITDIAVEGRPTRLNLQPGQRLLWVGYGGQKDEPSGLTVIDTVSNQVVARFTLPVGHHEITFSEDGDEVFVTSRQVGTVTVIDSNSLKILHSIKVEGEPIALAYSSINELLWVVDAKGGRVLRYHRDATPRDVIQLESGLGPSKLTPDGKFLFIVNPSQHRLFVLDITSGALRHSITVSGQPYDVMFSDQYAYVRTLSSEHVAMFALTSLKEKTPFVKYMAVGAVAVGSSKNLPIASTMTTTMDRKGAFLVNPAERTLYHYMEGMNAPDSSVVTYGHTPLAAIVVRRGLRTTTIGEYSTVLRLPSIGSLVLAVASQSPKVSECFGMRVGEALSTTSRDDVKLEWIGDTVKRVNSGATVSLRLRATNSATQVRLMSSVPSIKIVSAQARSVATWPLKPNGTRPGEWLATGRLTKRGGYFAFVDGNPPIKLHFATVVVSDDGSQKVRQ